MEQGFDRHIWRQVGDMWEIIFCEVQRFIKDSVGMKYLGYLVHHPDEPVTCSALVQLVQGPSPASGRGPSRIQRPYLFAGANLHITDLNNAEPILDQQTIRTCRDRWQELQGELQEAEDNNDLGRIPALRAEIDVLYQYLAGARGFRTRGCRTISPGDNPRTRVKQAITRAIARIRLVHPTLADHLQLTIRTGSTCCYCPYPTHVITWGS